MRYAIIKSGIVDNIIEWDGVSEYQVDGILVETDENTWIGGVYADGVFVERVPTAEEIAMQEEYQAQQEAKEALRQSLITKLATTLTPEETALLEELL
jgi:hypothetical protein